MLSQISDVITEPEAATAELVTAALHRNGVAMDTAVRAVDVMLRRELPISTVCRLRITYKDAVDESCPRSLFLKLPRMLSENTGGIPDDGRAEVEFYRDAAPEIGSPPLIRCYDAAYSEETKGAHILLDDLTDTHSQPEDTIAPSEEMSRRAVKALAKCHAHWWNSPRLGKGIGQLFDDGWLRQVVGNLSKNVAAFLEVAECTSSQRRAYDRMLNGADLIWGRLTRPDHLTVTHGDTHWWNFLYPKDPHRHAVHIFDWHLWHIDLGARDLAFLIALGGFAEPRPALEEELLRVYHETLGVADYSWEMLIEDYRWSAIRNLNMPVIYWSQGKHESTWRTALRRGWEAYERLGCGELL